MRRQNATHKNCRPAAPDSTLDEVTRYPAREALLNAELDIVQTLAAAHGQGITKPEMLEPGRLQLFLHGSGVNHVVWHFVV
jgi:hypothetical protein